MSLLRLENTPEGRVVSWLLLRDEEQMKMKMREGRRREKEREKPGCQDLQKHLKEGRKDCCIQGKYESEMNVCEDGMKKK